MAKNYQDMYILQKMRGWHSNWGLGFEETTGMVSNSLKISQQEIIKALKRLRREQSDNPEYRKLRRDLPEEWPIWIGCCEEQPINEFKELRRCSEPSGAGASFLSRSRLNLGFGAENYFLMREDEDGGAHCCEM
jgi:hypothetical protein